MTETFILRCGLSGGLMLSALRRADCLIDRGQQGLDVERLAAKRNAFGQIASLWTLGSGYDDNADVRSADAPAPSFTRGCSSHARRCSTPRKVRETNLDDGVLYGHNLSLYQHRSNLKATMNHKVKRQAVKGKRVARAFVAGLGSLLSVSAPQASHYHPAPSAQAALRNDFARIGRDMSVVVERERNGEKASR